MVRGLDLACGVRLRRRLVGTALHGWRVYQPGAVLDADLFEREAVDRFRNTILLAVMPVFFLSTGLKTTWTMGGLAVFGAAAVLLVASVTGKLAGIQIAGGILKWEKGEAGIIGWLLQTKALIMIIFVNILLDKRDHLQR